MIRSLRLAGSLASLCAGLLAVSGAFAEAYPNRPVTLIGPGVVG